MSVFIELGIDNVGACVILSYSTFHSIYGLTIPTHLPEKGLASP